MTTTPTSGAADLPEALHRVIDDFERRERGIPQAHIAAALVTELRAVLAAGQATAAQQGAAYAELPMQFACSGVFPVYSADQMRDFADRTYAMRTKSEANREFLERALSAMEGVIDVADRKTNEFDALRSCIVDLTLMLFKPDAALRAQQPAPAGATLPDGWVPLTITHEGQYPEEVAYGPQIMMDRLGKWLGKYFAQAEQADRVQEDVACWHWLAEYLVSTRTDLDDEIVASETVNDLRKLVEAAIKQGATP